MIDATTKNLVDLIRLLQGKLTDEQRLAVWEAIQEGYCPACGRIASNGCSCTNDE